MHHRGTESTETGAIIGARLEQPGPERTMHLNRRQLHPFVVDRKRNLTEEADCWINFNEPVLKKGIRRMIL